MPLVHLRHVPLLGPWAPTITPWQVASQSACAPLLRGRPPPGAVIAAGLCTLHSAHVRLRHPGCLQGGCKMNQAQGSPCCLLERDERGAVPPAATYTASAATACKSQASQMWGAMSSLRLWQHALLWTILLGRAPTED